MTLSQNNDIGAEKYLTMSSVNDKLLKYASGVAPLDRRAVSFLGAFLSFLYGKRVFAVNGLTLVGLTIAVLLFAYVFYGR